MSKSNKSKSKSVETVVETVTGSMLREYCESSIAARIEALMSLAATDPDGKHDATAKQWASERNSMGASFFDDCATLCNSGTLSLDTLKRALNASDAPVYGFAKIRGTLRALARGTLTGSGISALHYGALLALSDEYAMNDDVCKTIARVAVCSVTGTAPTQRSSSAYALSVLGMIEEQRIGRTGAMRWADTPAAHAMRDAMGAPRDVQKGATL